ncbi:hypothetical protein ACT4U1_16090 [Acinetobacter baumannii]|uniref:hypothetical protein n=2 Tax=Acinetobacter TaxID=469 RepID=UPI001D176303|nr:hypothetical protein [Acinetobacter baumannii]
MIWWDEVISVAPKYLKARQIGGLFTFLCYKNISNNKGIKMLKRETLKLIISSTGEEKELTQCTVSESGINSKDIKVPVREGDFLIRQLPSGLEEKYEIIDVVAYTSMLPHYEFRVRKV